MLIPQTLSHWLVIISACINLVGASAYIRDTLVGKTKPNRMSWLMWALAPLISTTAALSAGATVWVTLRVFLAGLLPLLVLVASFLNQQSYWRIRLFDCMCGCCSCLAIILWRAADSPQLAIVCAILGDGLASLPTIVKAWKYPDTETGAMYAASFISLWLVLPAIPEWTIANAAFQIHLLIISGILLIAVYRRGPDGH